MRILVILIFFNCIISFGQSKDKIYRLEAKKESPGIGSYIVNVLLLEEDGNYEIKYQEYLTKKRKKRNLIFNLKEEKGTWTKEGNILFLKDSKTNETFKFFIVNKNKIALFMDGNEISPVNWIRIR